MWITDQALLEDFMEEEIKKAFDFYLGFPFEEMDELNKNIYTPDYDIFRAGYIAGRF